jgi:hypothetical protein
MNTGQLLLTIGSMFILALVVLRVNNTFLSTSDIMFNSKFGVLAVSLGTSVIEEASGKAFDTKTDTASVTSTNLLTLANNLGPETGETYPHFNDFDDYNGLTKADSTMPSAVFNISCRVCYVIPNGTAITETSTRQWHKKIEVTVTSPSWKKDDGTPQSIVLSSIYSY